MDLQQDAKGIVQGAMAYFSSRSGTPAESKAKMMVQEQSPQDISKEDLMALCMKMNKRMHSLEAKLEDIRQKKDTLIEEKKSILLLILNWIGFSCNQSGEEPVDLLILQEAWDRWYSKMRSVTMPDLVSEESAIAEYEQYFMGFGVDGVFTEHPRTAKNAIEYLYRKSKD